MQINVPNSRLLNHSTTTWITKIIAKNTHSISPFRSTITTDPQWPIWFLSHRSVFGSIQCADSSQPYFSSPSDRSPPHTPPICCSYGCWSTTQPSATQLIPHTWAACPLAGCGLSFEALRWSPSPQIGRLVEALPASCLLSLGTVDC